jgi:hypothetical protein
MPPATFAVYDELNFDQAFLMLMNRLDDIGDEYLSVLCLSNKGQTEQQKKSKERKREERILFFFEAALHNTELLHNSIINNQDYNIN